MKHKNHHDRNKQNKRRNALAEFDSNLSDIILKTDASEASPQQIVELGAKHLTEYGCWRSDGAASLVTITILQGIELQLQRYECAENDDEDCDGDLPNEDLTSISRTRELIRELIANILLSDFGDFEISGVKQSDQYH